MGLVAAAGVLSATLLAGGTVSVPAGTKARLEPCADRFVTLLPVGTLAAVTVFCGPGPEGHVALVLKAGRLVLDLGPERDGGAPRFEVRAGDALVEARAGILAVALDEGKAVVDVLEGVALVRVAPPRGDPEQAVELKPGWEVRVADGAVVAPRPRKRPTPSLRGAMMVARGEGRRRRAEREPR